MAKTKSSGERDAIIIPLSDMHSGSNYALFLDRFWEGKNGLNHNATSKQQIIRAKWEEAKKEMAKEREGKRVIIVHNGDAIEGVHHNNVDVCTHDLNEQAQIHIELMSEFQKAIHWQRGDQIYYVLGTATHTLDIENDIAEEMNAQQLPDGSKAAGHLSLNINGRDAWFVHHGPGSGKGANEGNAIRNALRDLYVDSMKMGVRAPDIVYSGHTHNATYGVYSPNEAMCFRVMHWVILPSLQAKTRHAYRAVPLALNRVGVAMQVITSAGDIRVPKFYLTETETIMKV